MLASPPVSGPPAEPDRLELRRETAVPPADCVPPPAKPLPKESTKPLFPTSPPQKPIPLLLPVEPDHPPATPEPPPAMRRAFA